MRLRWISNKLAYVNNPLYAHFINDIIPLSGTMRERVHKCPVPGDHHYPGTQIFDIWWANAGRRTYGLSVSTPEHHFKYKKCSEEYLEMIPPSPLYHHTTRHQSSILLYYLEQLHSSTVRLQRSFLARKEASRVSRTENKESWFRFLLRPLYAYWHVIKQ